MFNPAEAAAKILLDFKVIESLTGDETLTIDLIQAGISVAQIPEVSNHLVMQTEVHGIGMCHMYDGDDSKVTFSKNPA